MAADVEPMAPEAWKALWRDIGHRMEAGERAADIWPDVRRYGVTLDQLIGWRLEYFRRSKKGRGQLGLLLRGHPSRR